MRPTVFIIGAGPGAPDLISVRGLRALQSAQVVIHDSRIHPRQLALAPATAERIDVGSAAPQAAEQDAINFLIAEKAREGHLVARLKWGDPFVFDRGGPEALFLHEQGVPFEVIPGVPEQYADKLEYTRARQQPLEHPIDHWQGQYPRNNACRHRWRGWRHRD